MGSGTIAIVQCHEIYAAAFCRPTAGRKMWEKTAGDEEYIWGYKRHIGLVPPYLVVDQHPIKPKCLVLVQSLISLMKPVVDFMASHHNVYISLHMVLWKQFVVSYYDDSGVGKSSL